MPQFGGKNAKKTSSDSKRHFTVVRGDEEGGLYISSSPSSAAKKAVTKLCTANKSKKVEFYIREITQGSKKKTYGPYEGYIEKLKEPIELKGRIIKYKPIAKLIRKISVKKGGMFGRSTGGPANETPEICYYCGKESNMTALLESPSPGSRHAAFYGHKYMNESETTLFPNEKLEILETKTDPESGITFIKVTSENVTGWVDKKWCRSTPSQTVEPVRSSVGDPKYYTFEAKENNESSPSEIHLRPRSGAAAFAGTGADLAFSEPKELQKKSTEKLLNLSALLTNKQTETVGSSGLPDFFGTSSVREFELEPSPLRSKGTRHPFTSSRSTKPVRSFVGGPANAQAKSPLEAAQQLWQQRKQAAPNQKLKLPNIPNSMLNNFAKAAPIVTSATRLGAIPSTRYSAHGGPFDNGAHGLSSAQRHNFNNNFTKGASSAQRHNSSHTFTNSASSAYGAPSVHGAHGASSAQRRTMSTMNNNFTNSTSYDEFYASVLQRANDHKLKKISDTKYVIYYNENHRVIMELLLLDDGTPYEIKETHQTKP